MFKPLTAIGAAAFIAAAITILTAPSTQASAGALPEAKSAPLRTCAQRAWPYNNCVGTPYGKPNVRLVTTERFAQ
jgi:hypothetical protein